MFKKQSKRLLLKAHSSPDAVCSLRASPPNYYTSHENAYDMEKEKLNELANEEQSGTKHEKKNSPETPQDHSCDETGMWL